MPIKEYLEVNKSDFLHAEAQDNYTLIAFQKDKKIHESILRATLSFIVEELPNDDFFKCHRSYLVCTDADFIYTRHNNKSFLLHPFNPIKLPESRTNEKQVKEIF